MRALSSLSAAGNLFTSQPANPNLNESISKKPPALPIPKRPPRSPPRQPPSPPSHHPSPAFKLPHSRTKYHKPIPPSGDVSDAPGGRAVVLGPDGVSYCLPGAPFEFKFSYSETPKAKPLAIREPTFLPFAAPDMPRPWTGKAPLLSKKEKARKRGKIRLFEPLSPPEVNGEEETSRILEMRGRTGAELGEYPEEERSREEILGAPLTREEVKALVKPHLSHNRQVNLGRDGLTHNMLELVHTHWKRQEICKVRCRGVPTVDMKNLCQHLEERTGGNIIHRQGGVVYLFRGRNYNPCLRPRYPVMLWKPAAPVYPKLIQEAPEGLTRTVADELRKKGENLLPIRKLAKNGIYLTLVRDVRDAFEGSPLVKLNCKGMNPSDYKKIGAKLMELVPCILLSFDNEQILMWRGKDWKSRYQKSGASVSKLSLADNAMSSNLNDSGPMVGISYKAIGKKEISSPRMLSLWKQAIKAQRALLLDDTELGPDSLLEKVEEFEGISQAAEHSYPALIISSVEGTDLHKAGSDFQINDDNEDDGDGFIDTDAYDETCEHDENDIDDCF